MPARQLLERDAPLRRHRQQQRGDQLVRRRRRLVEVDEEIVRLDDADAVRAGDLDRAAERQQAGRQFGRGIGERDRAAERAAVADRGVGDMRQGQCEQRRMGGDKRRGEGLGMAHQRADAQPFPVKLDAVEAGNAVDVHQHARAREPHIEQRDKALPARDDAGLAGTGAEQRKRLRDRSRSRIGRTERASLASSRTAVCRRCLILVDDCLSSDKYQCACPPCQSSHGRLGRGEMESVIDGRYQLVMILSGNSHQAG